MLFSCFFLNCPGTFSLCPSKGPTSHKTMSMVDRATNCMSGFLLLDMFKMVSDFRCSKLSLPKGSLFLANETCRNLQHCSLSMIQVVLSKHAKTDPWAHGHHRLCELGVEEHFGRLRTQASNAQLSARSFWKACARDMMKSFGPSSVPPKLPPCVEVHPLSDQEFEAASLSAFRSATKLVALASGLEEESLEKTYREWCERERVTFQDLTMGDEYDEELDDEGVGEEKGEVGATGLLTQIQAEAALESELGDVSFDHSAFELRSVPDRETLLEAMAGQGSRGDVGETLSSHDEGATIQGTPFNLSQALAPLGKAPSNVALFDRVWRLLMYCRYWHGGGDLWWVSDPRKTKSKTSKLNWHQSHGLNSRDVWYCLILFDYVWFMLIVLECFGSVFWFFIFFEFFWILLTILNYFDVFCSLFSQRGMCPLILERFFLEEHALIDFREMMWFALVNDGQRMLKIMVTNDLFWMFLDICSGVDWVSGMVALDASILEWHFFL